MQELTNIKREIVMRTLWKSVMALLVIFTVCGNVFANEITWHSEGTGGAVAAGGKESVAVGLSILKPGPL